MSINTQHNEKELFAQIANGDENAFTTLFHLYKAPLLEYALKITKTKTEAEELTQEVFLKLWAGRHHLAEVENASGYIYRIARNTAIDFFRKLTASTPMQNNVWAAMGGAEETTKEKIELNETQRLIQEGISKLPSSRQKVFYMSRQYGMSYEEIGKELGISTHTVKNHLVKALKDLREHLEKNYGAPVALIILSFLEKHL